MDKTLRRRNDDTKMVSWKAKKAHTFFENFLIHESASSVYSRLLRNFSRAKFLVGGLRMEDLGEVHNLYGSLSVVELQNVVDSGEAVKAKMREKNHVDRGTKFPNWLADPLFLKLKLLFIDNCKNCYSLPALGQLPCLKFLWIRGMHGITEVTEEFYGSLSSRKPFNSLVELRFEDMPEWKQWHVLGSGEFSTLENLFIIDCPELSLEIPIQLSCLKSFQVSGC
uniref:Potato resistance-like protein I2GA-SH194-2, putative n=1 Tax=Solanum demissum TaxID=50514 RepID=Q60D55_SOLDE|nr:potato resistance-like protein I2GA-SH194-2, putative [Solanum demissum]